MSSEKNQPLPTLTMDGWIHNKESIIERLFIYFLAGDVYQSNTFKDTIYTLKELVQSTRENQPLEGVLDSYLRSLYEPYFASVEPNITVEETETRKNYIIEIDFVDENGKKYNLRRILQMRDNVIENFQELLFSYKFIKKG